MARKEGGVKVGGLRIGCGWILLLIAGLTYGLWRWQPGVFRAAGERIAPLASRWVPAAGRWLKRAPAPSPAPTPAPQATPSPSPAPTPAPEASPSPSPEATPEAAPTPEPGPSPTGEAPETTDLVVGGGAEAKSGKTVLLRIAGTAEPVTIMLGAGDAPAGLEDGIVGMRAGGKRRIVFPEGARNSRFPPGGAARVAPDAAGECEVELVEVW